MMKKILLLATLFVVNLSFGQTTTYSISNDAADKLVVSANGYFLNEDSAGNFTPVTVTITSVTDFTGVTAPTSYDTYWMPIKDATNANYFVVSGGFKDSNAITDTTVGEVRTRTWELTQIDVGTASPAAANGDSATVKSSGGDAKDAGGALYGTTTRFANFSIDVVASYTPPSAASAVTISVTQAPTKINPTTGDLDQYLIFTIGNIPTNNTTGMNSRVYNSDVADLNAGGHVGFNLGAFTIDSSDADFDNGNTKTESTTPVNGLFDRTVTIKKYTAITGATTTDVLIGMRFVGGASLTFDNSLTPGTGGNANNRSFALVSSVDLDTTLSTGGVKNSLNVYPNPTTGLVNIPNIEGIQNIQVVNILGQVVKTVQASTQIDLSDLTSGVYVLLSDNGKQFKIVKK